MVDDVNIDVFCDNYEESKSFPENEDEDDYALPINDLNDSS